MEASQQFLHCQFCGVCGGFAGNNLLPEFSGAVLCLEERFVVLADLLNFDDQEFTLLCVR